MENLTIEQSVKDDVLQHSFVQFAVQASLKKFAKCRSLQTNSLYDSACLLKSDSLGLKGTEMMVTKYMIQHISFHIRHGSQINPA